MASINDVIFEMTRAGFTLDLCTIGNSNPVYIRIMHENVNFKGEEVALIPLKGSELVIGEDVSNKIREVHWAYNRPCADSIYLLAKEGISVEFSQSDKKESEDSVTLTVKNKNSQVVRDIAPHTISGEQLGLLVWIMGERCKSYDRLYDSLKRHERPHTNSNY